MLEEIDVAGAERLNPLRSMRARVAGCLEQLGHYLGIGLAVEAHLLHHRDVAHFLGDCRHDRPASSTGGQQDGSIDVEKDEPAPSRHHLCSSRRTATRRGLRIAARVPGSQGSAKVPPHANVEWIKVSASPAKAT